MEGVTHHRSIRMINSYFLLLFFSLCYIYRVDNQLNYCHILLIFFTTVAMTNIAVKSIKAIVLII